MKKITRLLTISLLLGFSSTAVLAETLSSNKDIIGSWLMEYSKQSEDAAGKKPMGMTWAFDSKQLTVKDIPQVRGDTYDAPAVDYIVEDGNLKVSVLGRAGKFDTYSLMEKTDTTMVLKDNKFGSYMFFTKK